MSITYKNSQQGCVASIAQTVKNFNHKYVPCIDYNTEFPISKINIGYPMSSFPSFFKFRKERNFTPRNQKFIDK